MQQAKFSLSDSLLEFLSHHQQYGFKDKSAMVQAALQRLMKEYEQRQLEESAALYAELYEVDSDLQELTNDALAGWPQ